MNTIDSLTHSFVPYSEKPSSAIVKSSEGSFYVGSRIENIAFPLSISAAQNALFCCLSEGEEPIHLAVTNHNDPLLDFWNKEFGLSIDFTNFEELSSYNIVDVRLQNGINTVRTLTELLAYARVGESDFPVSALVKTDQGYFSGVNIECSAWNLGLCAERVAIAKALAYGSKKLLELHIKTRDGDFTSPCGACRQVILEHMPHKQVHLYHKDSSKSVHFSGDLLPHCFSSPSLSKKKSQKQSVN